MTNKTPAAALPTTTEVIAAAHAEVKVTGTDRKRALRDAALAACAAAYGPFTLVETVTLKADEPKFSAWITGARGRNGWIISGRMGKAVVGSTTVEDFIRLGAVKNADVFTASAAAPTMKGIIG